jgi:hypothetical protein
MEEVGAGGSARSSWRRGLGRGRSRGVQRLGSEWRVGRCRPLPTERAKIGQRYTRRLDKMARLTLGFRARLPRSNARRDAKDECPLNPFGPSPFSVLVNVEPRSLR